MIASLASCHALAIVLPLAIAAADTVPLYSNASSNPNVPALSTGFLTSSGVAASNGQSWSEAQRDHSGAAVAIAGFSGQYAQGTVNAFRFADDFQVPAGQRWRLDEVELFAYAAGLPLSFWPFDRVYLQIWNGAPNDPASRPLLSQALVNRFISASQTTILRVFNTTATPQPVAPTYTRRIWDIRAEIPSLTLGPGTYWLDWQFDSSTTLSTLRAMVPPATIAGTRYLPTWNALQAQPGASLTWRPLMDPGKPASAPDVPQDLPFILKGSRVTPGCAADVNSDGVVNNADLTIILTNWGQIVPPGTRGDANNDGVVNYSDLTILLTGFNSTC